MSTDAQPSFDTRAFRNALGRFATGVTVITAVHEDHPHGMTANAFVSVSLTPPLILVSLDNRSNMHKILPATGRFGVSILAENQEALSTHFAGRPQENLQVSFVDRARMPVIKDAVAYFVARVTATHPAGDHMLYIGEVEHFEHRDDRPLLFHAGKYGRLGL